MSNFPMLVKQNKRRFSEHPADIAFMQHVESCFYTYGGDTNGRSAKKNVVKCNTVDGLCPEGQRLDSLCPDYKPEPVTALDIFLLAAQIVEMREHRAIVEKIAREEV